MFHRTLRAAAVLAILALPSAALAQSTQSSTIAESLFREAQSLLEAGKINEACDKFAASQKVEPTAGTLLNLAACHEKAGKTATAWTEYAEVASLAQRGGDKDREKYARGRVAALEKGLSRVVIEILTPKPDQEVTLDQQKLAREAWGTGIPLDPGEHTIEVKAPGKKTWTRKINVGPSNGVDRIEVPPLENPTDDTALPAPMPVGQSAPTEQAPPASDKGGSSTGKILGFGLLGLGVVGLGVGTYFGFSSLSHGDKRDELCPPGNPCAVQQAYQEHHDSEQARNLMLITGGIGLVAAGAGAYILLAKPFDSRTGSIRIKPAFAPNAADLRIEGAF